MKDVVYSQKDLKSLKLITNDYEFNMSQIGEFEAVLDLKAETYNKDLRVFFTLLGVANSVFIKPLLSLLADTAFWGMYKRHN